MPRHVCTYGEEHPGLFKRSDATQIQRHLKWIFLEIRAHQLADPSVTIDMSSRVNSAVAHPPQIDQLYRARARHWQGQADEAKHQKKRVAHTVATTGPTQQKKSVKVPEASNTKSQTFDVFCQLACHKTKKWIPTPRPSSGSHESFQTWQFKATHMS
jgi:hypothetical protein